MKCLVILIFILSATVFVAGQDLKGIVKTSDGKPIADVWIRPGYRTETDKDGKFVIKENKDNFIILTKQNFRPLIKRLNGESEIEIFLEAENKADRLLVPECTKKNTGKHVGVIMKFFIPDGFKSGKGNDVDYSNYVISSKRDKNFFMQGWSGANAASGYPDSDWILASDKINVRSIYSEYGFLGFDYEGQTKEGKYWRYFQIFDESVYYIVDSSEQKGALDKIFASSCTTTKEYFKD
jgi:hypothetical protein